MILKKLTTLFSVLFFATLPLQALPADNVKEYTLENNMKIFLLKILQTPLFTLNLPVMQVFLPKPKIQMDFFFFFFGL